MNENELRDAIAKDISVLEPGLVLLAKEKYIPNLLGTRGFIDIYAQDQLGHHVLIELKRSNAAAREAIHEVHKYAEGVKAHLGARDDEIRIIVASTEWKELLVPFSSLLSDTHLTIAGISLQVDGDSREISATPVTPLPTNKGRFLAPWHELNLYESRESLVQGISSYETSCVAKGIKDYVLIVLEPSESFNDLAKEQLRAGLEEMRRQFGGDASDPQVEKTVSRLPVYQYLLYFATQILLPEACLGTIADEPEILEEVNACLDDMDEEEALCLLHEKVFDLQPRPHRDYLEIGYPAKFGTKLLDDEGWVIREIKRYGMFSRNPLLQDESIISELRGNTGVTGQRFKRKVSVANRAHMSAAKTDLRDCLNQNPVWQAHILRNLTEIEADFPCADIEISVFNPSTGILTIYFAATREDGALFVPTYSILVHERGERRLYYGCLVADGKANQFTDILAKYYDADISGLLLSFTWGGYEPRDTDILEDIGLVYRSFRCDISDDSRNCFSLRDERWRSCKCVNPVELFAEYLSGNNKLVNQVVGKIAPRHSFGIVDASNTNLRLDQVADLARGQAVGNYFASSVVDCDICGCSLEREKYIIDGALKMESAWALMCPDCFANFGKGIGPGTGQLYIQQSGQWLMVGGFLTP